MGNNSPLPPLQPAVFPPSLPEPPAVPLELFDLDEQFSSPHTRLAALTGKCNGTTDEDELAYYITECAAILGVSTSSESGGIGGGGGGDLGVLSSNKHAAARNLLSKIFTQIASWKMPQSAGDDVEDDGSFGAEDDGGPLLDEGKSSLLHPSQSFTPIM